MTKYSSKTEEILEAAIKAQTGSCYIQFEEIIAAALRTVADQVAPANFQYDTGSHVDGALEFEQGQECRNEAIRDGLLSIADELEGFTRSQ